jgi:signal transduction histidine kinase
VRLFLKSLFAPGGQANRQQRLRYGKLWWAVGVVLATGLVALLFLQSRQAGPLPSLPYVYQDTKQLVLLVDSAAHLVEQRGRGAFREFAVPESKWFNVTYYIFIYDVNGVCLFHPAEPELVGKNLINLKDMNGKPILREITEIGRRPGPKASGWIFYLWARRSELTPTWKMSYIRKAIGPDGRVYLVGSGVHNFKIEPLFVKNAVDQAAALLQSQGREVAFAQFRDRASPFFFCDTYIYVMDTQGRCLVDPAFPSLERRNMLQIQDATGHYVVKEMLKLLEQKDTARLEYMVPPKSGTTMLIRKLAYLRKVTVKGEPLIVMSDFPLATPIWMKQ